MRAGAAAAAGAVAMLVSCTGERATRPAPSTTSTSPPTTSGPPSTATSTPASSTDLPGSVTFRAGRFSLPAGTALRVGLRASAPRLTVRRRGGGGALSVCPVTDASSPANPVGCVALEASGPVDLSAPGGVEIRATGSGATVDEVALSYAPVDRSTTVVTPPRPAGSCAATACEATFSLSPPQGGSFTLQGRAGGGRPRLTLQAEGGATAGSRVLATAEGGAALSISATLEPNAQAVVLYREQVEGAVGALTMEISWP